MVIDSPQTTRRGVFNILSLKISPKPKNQSELTVTSARDVSKFLLDGKPELIVILLDGVG